MNDMTVDPTDRSHLASLGLIGDELPDSPPPLPRLPLGAVREVQADVEVTLLGVTHTVTVRRIVSTLPPAGSRTRYH